MRPVHLRPTTEPLVGGRQVSPMLCLFRGERWTGTLASTRVQFFAFETAFETYVVVAKSSELWNPDTYNPLQC